MFAFITNRIKLYLARKKWRKSNSNNDTYMGNYFEPEIVSVGIRSYGLLNVICHNNINKLKIGNYCSIAPDVVFILNGEHNIKTISTFPYKTHCLKTEKYEAGSSGNIQIDDDVWIGYGATIMSGVHIGQGAVIAARAVVTRDVNPYEVVGGVPAKKIYMRFEQNIVDELMKVNYQNLTNDMIIQHEKDLYSELKSIDQLKWLPKKREG